MKVSSITMSLPIALFLAIFPLGIYGVLIPVRYGDRISLNNQFNTAAGYLYYDDHGFGSVSTNGDNARSGSMKEGMWRLESARGKKDIGSIIDYGDLIYIINEYQQLHNGALNYLTTVEGKPNKNTPLGIGLGTVDFSDCDDACEWQILPINQFMGKTVNRNDKIHLINEITPPKAPSLYPTTSDRTNRYLEAINGIHEYLGAETKVERTTQPHKNKKTTTRSLVEKKKKKPKKNKKMTTSSIIKPKRKHDIQTIAPTITISGMPSDMPSLLPSDIPSLLPSGVPSISTNPSASGLPSGIPSFSPSSSPSDMASFSPSSLPSYDPTHTPTTAMPTSFPSNNPSIYKYGKYQYLELNKDTTNGSGTAGYLVGTDPDPVLSENSSATWKIEMLLMEFVTFRG